MIATLGRLTALSGMSRRRVALAIALARAFLRDAPLVVLDEPTANLDPAAARIVGESVERLRVGRTVLLIAHDAALARRADRSIAIVDGRAAESSQ